MKSLKTTFAAFVMMFVLVFGTTFANAGIIIAAQGGTGDCTVAKSSGTYGKVSDGGKLNTGIIIAYTGIIIAYTGIIIALKEDSTTTKQCVETNVQKVGIIIA